MRGFICMAASDDSHLAGDSKPSENKHFAGMAAEVTEGTSDDTHLADDSKRQENAAGSSGYAPPVQEERRIASDGNSYTFRVYIRDPNRGGQLRLDYVFENLEGVRCQLHPGNRNKDALPIFTQV